MYDDYSEIRLYGAGIEPYRLPIFVPMRLFSLEFIRQSLNVDQIHFVPMKKGHLFKLPMYVGPFIVNMRQATNEANKMLENMHFLLGEKWAYDSHKVIYNRRVENGYSAFVHESKPEIKKLASKGFSYSNSTSIQNPIISERISKISKGKVVDSEDEQQRAEKRARLTKEIPSTQPGFLIQLGDA